MNRPKAGAGLLALMFDRDAAWSELEPGMARFAAGPSEAPAPFADVQFPGVCTGRRDVTRESL